MLHYTPASFPSKLIKESLRRPILRANFVRAQFAVVVVVCRYYMLLVLDGLSDQHVCFTWHGFEPFVLRDKGLAPTGSRRRRMVSGSDFSCRRF